uniref:FU n=1 Tax=Arundo donax TaxID=35708 RepID=A0A0A9F6M1_ARUDO
MYLGILCSIVLSISLFSVPIRPPGDATLRRKPLLMDADVDGMFGELCTTTNGNARISTTEFISSRTPLFPPPRPVQAANALRCISDSKPVKSFNCSLLYKNSRKTPPGRH